MGDFIEGAYNGKGTHLTNQNLYIGEFKNDLPNGEGTLFMNTGSMYVGGFQQGDMNGKGYFQHPDGTIEEAFWKEGKPTGKVIQEEFPDRFFLLTILFLPDGKVYLLLRK